MDKQAEDNAFEIAVDFAPLPDPLPVASPEQHMAPADPVAGDEPTAATEGEAESPAPPAKRARKFRLGGALPLLIAGLATFAALVATIGLIVVSRNVAETNQRLAALQAALDHKTAAPAPVAHAPAIPSLAPVTGSSDKPASIEEVRALLFALRKDLVSYQAMGGNAGWVKAVGDGQAELANRMSLIAEKVDRIERRTSGARPEAR